MSAHTKESLRAEIKALEAELSRVRAARAQADPTSKPEERVARATLALENGRIALWVFEVIGDIYGLVIRDDDVIGSIPVKIPPGISHEERARLIDDAVVGPLNERASEMGAIIAASPSRFTRERPGRDAEGRTILDVRARLEGDRLIPAVSKASRHR